MKLSLTYPAIPVHVNQGFGENPAYYARFIDGLGKPEKGHNGIDFMAAHGQPVYAPVDGLATYITDAHGGEGVYIFTGPYDYAGGTCWFNVILWHLVGDTDPKYPKPFSAKQVKQGDLVGYADNTGAPFESSGDHLHMGLIPCDSRQKPLLIDNGFNGCIDATPYLGYSLSTLQKILAFLKARIGLK